MDTVYSNAFAELFNELLQSDKQFLSSDSKRLISRMLHRHITNDELDSNLLSIFWYDDDVPYDVEQSVIKDIKKAIANMILAG